MKRRQWNRINSLLAALVLLLAMLNWRVGTSSAAVAATSPTRGSGRPGSATGDPATTAGSPSPAPSGDAAGNADAPPSAIAAAFGWSSPPPPPSPAPVPSPERPSPKPETASWIRYLGAITGSDGITYRYFKDERSGDVIRAAVSVDVEGWQLFPRADGGYLLSHGESRLMVRTDQ
ncbi:hypothetical protein [Salinispira pacifica]